VGKVTAVQAKNATKTLNDGDNLYLMVDKRILTKNWVLRNQFNGKRPDTGLGGYPCVSLGEARHRAEDMRRSIREDRNRIEERKSAAETIPSFREAAKWYKKSIVQDLLNRLEDN
jgi:hypothetical protein